MSWTVSSQNSCADALSPPPGPQAVTVWRWTGSSCHRICTQGAQWEAAQKVNIPLRMVRRKWGNQSTPHTVNPGWTLAGLPRWLSGEESAHQCRRRRFDPWIRKIPWRRKWPPTPSILAWGNPRGAWQATVMRSLKSQTWLSN